MDTLNGSLTKISAAQAVITCFTKYWPPTQPVLTLTDLLPTLLQMILRNSGLCMSIIISYLWFSEVSSWPIHSSVSGWLTSGLSWLYPFNTRVKQLWCNKYKMWGIAMGTNVDKWVLVRALIQYSVTGILFLSAMCIVFYALCTGLYFSWVIVVRDVWGYKTESLTRHLTFVVIFKPADLTWWLFEWLEVTKWLWSCPASNSHFQGPVLLTLHICIPYQHMWCETTRHFLLRTRFFLLWIKHGVSYCPWFRKT